MSLRRLFVFLLFAGVLAMALRPVADPDFWWHLRSGQWMVENRSILREDIFSFTRAGQEWITHEWLAEILIAVLYRLGGFELLILVFALLITATFALLYLRCEGKPYLAGFGVVLGFLAAAPVLGVRPQMFTFFLSSLYWYLLEHYRATGAVRWLFPLPLLMLLWVNMHGGYMTGLFLILVFALEALIEVIRKRVTGRACLYPWGAVLLLSAAAVVANPHGGRLYRYPFETLVSPAMQANIQEWFSPDFHAAHWQFLALLLIGSLLIALFARLKLHLADAFLLGFFCYSTLRSGRHVPFFVLAAVPVFSAGCANLFGKYLLMVSPLGRIHPVQKVLPGMLAVLCLAALTGRYLDIARRQPVEEQAHFPADAVAWLEHNRPPPNLYNTYEWGGYLIWRLYPHYQVFIDGRADLYGDVFIGTFLRMYAAEVGWETDLERYQVNTVLIRPTAPLAKVLRLSEEWAAVYSDEQAIIFIRR